MAIETYVPPEGKVVLQTELNLDSRPYAPVVYLTQYDATTPIISAFLYLNDEPYTIPATASVNIRMTKPDGKHVYNPALGTNADKTVVYIAVTSQMTAAYGRGYAIVEIANEAGLIGSARMTLAIDRNPTQETEFESSDEYKTLQQIVDEVNLAVEEADGHADRAEDAVKKAETSKNEAQTQAEEAKRAAQAAEQSNQDATEQALAAKSSAEEAAKSAETAKQYSGNTPIVKNGNWWAWNAENQTYEDTGKKAVLTYDVTYSSVDEMEEDKDNKALNTLAIIQSGVEDADNAKLYIHDGTDWKYLADLSGLTGVGIQKWEKTSGSGAAGTFDDYTVTWTDGRTFEYQVYNGANGEGAGDMLAAVYDKQNRNTDIFDYVDEAMENVQQQLHFDAAPVEGSQNPVYSGGVYTSIKAVKDDLDSHKDTTIANEAGVHGIRYHEKRLQAYVGNEWINVGGAGLTITATVETGSIVTATRMDEDGESVVVTAESVGGKAVLELLMAGTYSVYAELNGIRSETVQVVCSGNYPASMRYIKLTVTVDSGSSVTVSKDADSYTKTSDGTATFYLPSIGTWSVRASLNEQETSSTVIVSEYKDYTLELSYISSVLNDNTWETISKASSNGTASSTWSVGDTKEITINGLVGDTMFNNLKINVFIIGFDHNASIEGDNKIHFLLGKIEDKLVALVDSRYSDQSNSEGAFTMNTTHTNIGGWESSHMRKTILGSDKAPTSQSGNTLISALPTDLRAVMKPITKYTDNKGGGNDTATNVSSTTDYLPLLAELEIFGERVWANSAEQKYQKQYAYFMSANQKTFYEHNKKSEKCTVNLRSPYFNDGDYFCGINSDYNSVGRGGAAFSYGVSAILAV